MLLTSHHSQWRCVGACSIRNYAVRTQYSAREKERVRAVEPRLQRLHRAQTANPSRPMLGECLLKAIHGLIDTFQENDTIAPATQDKTKA